MEPVPQHQATAVQAPVNPARPGRLLHPIPEARYILGGISQSGFYNLVNAGKIRLTKVGKRSFVHDDETRRVAREMAEASAG